MKRARGIKYALAAGLTALAVLIAPVPANAYSSAFTWTVGSDVAATDLTYADSPLSIFKVGSYVYVVYPTGDNQWLTYRGADMDHLTYQYTFDASTSNSSAAGFGFVQPRQDDRYWISGGWVDPVTGAWYAIVHMEFKYGGAGYDHFRRMGTVISTDLGQTWHYEGDILTGANTTSSIGAYSGSYFDFGVGDGNLLVDEATGYFYVFWSHVVFNKSNGTRFDSIRVSRSAISDRMRPGTWQNWYNGDWSEPGLGGLSTDLPFPNGNSFGFSYNSYLGKYMAVGNPVSTDGASFDAMAMSTATNMATQNWTDLDKLTDGNRSQWYHTFIDPTTSSSTTVGQTFRMYSTSNNAVAASKYMTVTLGTGTSTGWTASAQRYPSTSSTPESVRDGNSGWQTATAPSAPTITSTSAVAGGATVNWNAVSGATGYTIEYGTSSGSYQYAVDGGSGTSFTLKNLSPGSTYYIRLRAYTEDAIGGRSSEATVVPSGVTNLATSGTASQSSTFTGSGCNNADAYRANDGNTDGVFCNHSVAATNVESHAYWQVDLGAVHPVSEVQIWNRTDCCTSNTSDYWLFTSDVPFSSTDPDVTVRQSGVTAQFFHGSAGRPTVASVDRSARYVRIQLAGSNQLLLSEVKVNASPTNGDSIAQYSSTQGSGNWSYMYSSSHTAMVWNSGTSTWNKSGDVYTAVNATEQLPGSSSAVRAWQAPKSGYVVVSGNLHKVYTAGGSTLTGTIQLNASTKWTGTVAYNDAIGVNHRVVVPVSAGDWLYFTLSSPSSSTADEAYWNQAIVYLPADTAD